MSPAEVSSVELLRGSGIEERSHDDSASGSSACTEVAPSIGYCLPVWACTRPFAEASRMLPAPSQYPLPLRCRGSTLPPPVVAFTRPLHLSPNTAPPLQQGALQPGENNYASPAFRLDLPLADAILMFPPPVCRLTLPCTPPTSIVPPPVSAVTSPPISSGGCFPAALEVDTSGNRSRLRCRPRFRSWRIPDSAAH